MQATTRLKLQILEARIGETGRSFVQLAAIAVRLGEALFFLLVNLCSS